MNYFSLKDLLFSVPVIVLCALILLAVIVLIVVVIRRSLKRRAFLNRKLKKLESETDENQFLSGKLAGMNSRLRRSMLYPPEEKPPMPNGVEEGTKTAVSEALQDARDSLMNFAVTNPADEALEKVAEKTARNADPDSLEQPAFYDPALTSEVEKLLADTCKTTDVSSDAAPVAEPLDDGYSEVSIGETADDSYEKKNEADEKTDDSDEDTDGGYSSFSGKNLDFIDPEKDPEAYARLLSDAEAGKVKLVTKVRKAFRANLIQAEGLLQTYHSDIKNELLKYKGVSCRESQNYEAFRCGQNQIAKMICKGKTLQLYLAIDPTSLDVTGYSVTDVSDKKKFAATPTLLKIKGDRKYKYAKELIDRMCVELFNLQLKKNFVPADETLPFMTEEELAKAGLVKILYAGEPISPAAESAAN